MAVGVKLELVSIVPCLAHALPNVQGLVKKKTPCQGCAMARRPYKDKSYYFTILKFTVLVPM